MLSVSSFIALKYIQSKKFSFLPSLSFTTSFLGIFLSVFTLVTVISVMEGFSSEFQKNIIGLRSHIKIYFSDKNGQIEDISNYQEKIKKINNSEGEILHVSGGIAGEVMLSNPKFKNLSGALVLGLNSEDVEFRPLIKNNIIKGSLENFNESEGVIIGEILAKELKLNIGDEINLISPIFRKTAFGSIPIHKSFKINAIFNVGMHFYDSAYIFLPIKQAQVFFQKQDKVSFLEVMVKNPDKLSKSINEIKDKFQNIYITDWKTENKSFIEAINLQKSVMFFILVLFLLLSGFIIFSGLSSLVQSKNKTTAILRTMGINKLQVLSIFLKVGLFSVIPAISFGALFGCLFVLKLENIKNKLEQILETKIFDGAYYFLSYLPSSLDFKIILKILLMSFFISLFSILIPSLRSIKSNPMESLKWE